jgi:hypothetical protein
MAHLLVVFIHGFGSDDLTFGHFPNEVRDYLLEHHYIPRGNVVECVLYPTYEARTILPYSVYYPDICCFTDTGLTREWYPCLSLY